MRSVPWLLAIGNGKLGSSIAHFDLPPVDTCPGRSTICEQLCYAKSGRFRFRNVRDRLDWCYQQSQDPYFVRQMVAEIRSRGIVIVRLHVAGDFADATYALKWLRIMRLTPRVRYYFYTRSWRIPDIAFVLARMATLANVRIWYSCDRDTGLPDAVPEGVRLAYLQDTPACPEGVDLVFRPQELRTQSRVGLPLVCPSDTPQGRHGKANCGSCGLCWS